MHERLFKIVAIGGYGMISAVLIGIVLRRPRTFFTRPAVIGAGTIALHALEVALRDEKRLADSGVSRAVRFLTAVTTCGAGTFLVATFSEMIESPSAAADVLTQLPNRVFFDKSLLKAITRVRASRRSSTAGLVFVDLDDFKSVNDRHGHSTGDQVLMETASRLRVLAPPPNVAARIGGDEFAILLVKLKEPTDIEMFVQKVRDTFLVPFLRQSTPIVVTASIGSAVVDGLVDLPDVMRAADEAMYKNKRTSRKSAR